MSSRRSALRLFLSGPWQAKQLSARIGRTSRLNSMVFGSLKGGPPARAERAVAAVSHREDINTKAVAIGRMFINSQPNYVNSDLREGTTGRVGQWG